MIKVLVVDDQKLLVDGIISVLNTSDELTVVGFAYDGDEAFKKVKELNPDVVLLDIRMPNQNGVITTSQIKNYNPDIKVLILTTFDDSQYILDALNLGASGYLLKDIASSSLIEAIINAHNGDTILPSKIARKITAVAKTVSNDREIKLKKKFNFTDREVNFAMMIYEGFNNKQISSAMSLSDGTTRNYISNVYFKLGAENRTEAIEIMKSIIG